MARYNCPPCGQPLGAGAPVCQYAYQPGGKTRDTGRWDVRTPHRAGLMPPLTSRRHIDLVRTSSAICQPA
ncbi:putative leader peptide [Streptomyces sp. 4.24]|uniref:putative leader peptide n=1 Tax=Streptomyces tritrimontium TaxID=3406573 RepID=UPI003BB79465